MRVIYKMKRLWYFIKCFLPSTEERKFKKWYEDLRDSAIEWNVTTLVENTITMQIRKVCEEVGEVLDAETYEEAINEKADVLISVWGISAFDTKLGMKAERFFWDTNNLPIKEILIAAEAKITELHKRTYVKDGKVYRHIQEQRMLN